MSKLNNYHLMRMADMNDEDAFEPMDFSAEEIDAMFYSKSKNYIKEYKAYYNDVKVSRDIYKEDW